jgi:hypothetical protein
VEWFRLLVPRGVYRDDDSAPSRTCHAQSSTRHAQNGFDRFDEPLAPRRTMHLGEAFQCNFESDEVAHTEQWGDRHLCELWGASEEAREVLLNVSGNSRFDLRIHLKGGNQGGGWSMPLS